MQSFKVPEHLMLASGLPRNDALYHVTDTKILALKQQLGLPLDKKIILYAPTWRDSDDQGKTYSLKPPIHLDKWEERLGEHYILLFRTHHYTTRLLGVQFNDFVRDVSNYPSINDLFIVSDLLISDYSSCITDYSILERPVVCFAYDYDAYSKQRGINIDFRTEMPAGIQKTEDEVLDHILNMDEAEECRKTREMLKNRFTYIGGHATEICINAVFGKENDKQ